MKLRKILAGFLAGTIAMTSSVVMSVTASAEEETTPLWEDATQHYIDSNTLVEEKEVLTWDDLANITQVVANVTYTSCNEWSNGELYVNCDTSDNVYFGTAADKEVANMEADTAYDVTADVTVSNWF